LKDEDQVLLNIQYRMHPYLLQIPNALFYNNEIENGVKDNKFFLDMDKPLFFINVKGHEALYGTSFINNEEAEAVK
jgi:superfamily I DNA and/or RNA helicase